MEDLSGTIFEELKEFLGVKNKEVCFLTGSSFWGIAGNDSDVDIAVLIPFVAKAKEYLLKHAAPGCLVEHSGYFASFSCNIKTKDFLWETKVNIIPLSPTDFVVWKQATLFMQELLRCDYVRDKIKTDKYLRVLVFQQLRLSVTMALGHPLDLEECQGFLEAYSRD